MSPIKKQPYYPIPWLDGWLAGVTVTLALGMIVSHYTKSDLLILVLALVGGALAWYKVLKLKSRWGVK